MLACRADGDYFDDPSWWYMPPEEVEPLDRKRWRKCCSCKGLIRPGDDCAEFFRWRSAKPDSIEERIYGDEVPMTTWFLCDRCYGLYESLDSLGYCNLLGQNLIDLCKEYAEMQRAAGIFTGKMEVKR
jgi:hypothetical protein